jgi:DNA-binding response OmpR family regulator
VKVLLGQTPDTQLPNLSLALEKHDHQAESIDLCALCHPGELEATEIDIAVIDASCGSDGVLCCKVFHEVRPDVPIILLLAEEHSADSECQHAAGGNILWMPCTSRKVINRIAKVGACHIGRVITVGELTLNMDKRCVVRGDVVHHLTPRQAELLEVFMQHSGRTLTRKFLMETVWKTDYMGDTRTLDVHVRWIRERIEAQPSSPRYLRTVRGIGYRFGVPSDIE